jgi:hypothetical protein
MPRELMNMQLFDFPELEIVIQNYMNDFFNENAKKQEPVSENRLAS